jgi:hypothetical protein
MKQVVSKAHCFKRSLGGKPVKNLLFLELKTLKDLKDIPQKWMLILEILTYEMGLRKLDLFISSLVKSTH